MTPPPGHAWRDGSLHAWSHTEAWAKLLPVADSWRRQRPGKCLREPSEHHEVGVQAEGLQATGSEQKEAIVLLQAPELAFHAATLPPQYPSSRTEVTRC